MAKTDGGDYFKRSSMFWFVSVSLGLAYFTCIVFAPERIPYQYLGPFGTFCRYLVDNHADTLYKGWWVSFAIHVIEAFVALKVCSHKGINNTTSRCLWFLQTFWLGYFSLGLLVKYDPERPKQH